MALTSDEYVGCGGAVCPNCTGTSFDVAHPLQVDGNQAWTQITCQTCLASWRDVYQLVGYEDLTLVD